VLFLDDFGDTERRQGYHRSTREAVAAAFDRLRETGQVIVADVHTHPEAWVGLSGLDMAHPIEFRVGLLAIVIPHFALGGPTVGSIGVHRYLGQGEWRSLRPQEVMRISSKRGAKR
jgi:hypothetical protein